MKHRMPRKLVLREKKLLKNLGFNPNNFLRSKKDDMHYEFIEAGTGNILKVEKVNNTWTEAA